MLKPVAFLALTLSTVSAFAAPADPVQSMLQLDHELEAQLVKAPPGTKDATELYREELPLSASDQKSNELGSLPMAPAQDTAE